MTFLRSDDDPVDYGVPRLLSIFRLHCPSLTSDTMSGQFVSPEGYVDFNELVTRTICISVILFIIVLIVAGLRYYSTNHILKRSGCGNGMYEE
jgi:hypothetical protein